MRILFLAIMIALFLGCKTRSFASKSVSRIMFSCSNVEANSGDGTPFEFVIFGFSDSDLTIPVSINIVGGSGVLDGSCRVPEEQGFYQCRSHDSQIVVDWLKASPKTLSKVKVTRQSLLGLINERQFEVSCQPTTEFLEIPDE